MEVQSFGLDTIVLLLVYCPVDKTLLQVIQEICCLNVSNRYCGETSVVQYPRYLDTYRRYLRDDTSIAKVTIYRGIS